MLLCKQSSILLEKLGASNSWFLRIVFSSLWRKNTSISRDPLCVFATFRSKLKSILWEKIILQQFRMALEDFCTTWSDNFFWLVRTQFGIAVFWQCRKATQIPFCSIRTSCFGFDGGMEFAHYKARILKTVRLKRFQSVDVHTIKQMPNDSSIIQKDILEGYWDRFLDFFQWRFFFLKLLRWQNGLVKNSCVPSLDWMRLWGLCLQEKITFHAMLHLELWKILKEPTLVSQF